MYVIDQAVLPEDHFTMPAYLHNRCTHIRPMVNEESGSLISAVSSLRHATKRLTKLVGDIGEHYNTMRTSSVAETNAALHKYLDDAHKDIKATPSHLGNSFDRLSIGGGVDYVASTEFKINHSLNLSYNHCIHRSVTYPRMLIITDIYGLFDPNMKGEILMYSEFTLMTPEGEVELADRLKLLDMCPNKSICELLWVINTAVRPIMAT